MKHLIALAALAITTAHAEPSWHVVGHTTSHHFSERTNGKQWNETNPGVALRYALDATVSAQVGVYRNSINRTTGYAIADWTPVQYGPLSAGVFGGVRTGYTSNVQAAAGALVRWQGEQASVTVRLTPKASNTGSAMVSIELGWKL